MQYSAIFFDLDDTLCAYWDAAKAGLKSCFSEVLTDGVTPQQLHHAWVLEFRKFCPHLKNFGWYERYLADGGSSRTELMRLTLQSLGIDSPSLAERLSASYYAHRHSNLKLFPESLEVLDQLSQCSSLGLITNGPADVQNLQIDLLRIRGYFKWIFVEGELGFGKPDPRVLERAERSAGSSGPQLLMVGNSYRSDILAAIEKGWDTFWVRRDSDVPPSAGEDNVRPEELPENHPRPTFEYSNLLPLLQF